MNVKLVKGDEVRHGTISWDYPVDVPAAITSEGTRLYAYVWEYNGWVLEFEDDDQ